MAEQDMLMASINFPNFQHFVEFLTLAHQRL